MARLFTYVIPIDDGAAPNPYWETCTLTICKPAIRRVAAPGDWVVGTGSANAPGLGNISMCVVYAMKVERSLPLAQYDAWAKTSCPGKVPDLTSIDRRRHLGDAVWDHSSIPPRIRLGVHDEGNRITG